MKILTYIVGAVVLPFMIIALLAAPICMVVLIVRLVPEWLLSYGIAGLALTAWLWVMHDAGMVLVSFCEERKRERGQ